MPVASRLASFEDWSKVRGLVARDVDRRRVARELLELAADAPVTEEHIETLTKRYRDGLMGARSVLAARRVAQELLEWQDEVDAPADAEPRPRSSYGDDLAQEPDDESFEREPPVRQKPRQDSAPPRLAGNVISSYPPPTAADSDWPLDAPAERSQPPAAPSDRPRPRSERAPARSDAPPPRARADTFPSAPPPRARADTFPSAPPPRARADTFPSAPPPRARADTFPSAPPPPAARSERAPAPPKRPEDSWRPSRLEEEARRAAARRGPLSRQPPISEDDETPMVAAVFEDEEPRSSARAARAAPSRRPSALEEEVGRSGRPSPTSRRPSPLENEPRKSLRPAPSRRPLDDDAFQLDDEPKAYKTGFSKPPSIRAPAAGLPELERTEGDVDAERKLRARDEIEDNVAPPPAEADARALSERPPLKLPPAMQLPPVPEPNRSRLLMIVGGIVALAVVILLITRPGCIFASNARRLAAGTFISKHLGLAWEFPESWLHAERLDSAETTPQGWTRKTSVFYHGANPNAFQNQFVALVFEKPGAQATEEEARQLGVNEVMAASRRTCEPLVIRNTKATRCIAMAARPGQPLGVIETSFVLDGRAIFLRFQYEVAMPVVSGNPDDAAQQSEMLQEKLTKQLIDADKLALSMRTLPR